MRIIGTQIVVDMLAHGALIIQHFKSKLKYSFRLFGLIIVLLFVFKLQKKNALYRFNIVLEQKYYCIQTRGHLVRQTVADACFVIIVLYATRETDWVICFNNLGG